MRHAPGLSVARGSFVFGLVLGVAASSLAIASPAFAEAPKGSGKAPAQAASAPPPPPPAPTAAPAPPPGYNEPAPAPAPPPGYAAPQGALPPPPPPPYPYPYGYGQPSFRPMDDEVFKEQISELKRRIKAADENEDEREKARLKEELDELNAEYKKYKKENYTRYSTGMMVGGIVLSGLGGVSLFAGIAVSLATRDNTRQVGYGMLVFGALGISLGIPLAVVGARRVRKDSLEANAGPSLLVGPRSVGLRMAF